MRMVPVYLEKAAELVASARRINDLSQVQQFLDMADIYCLLAEERRRRIDEQGRPRPKKAETQL